MNFFEKMRGHKLVSFSLILLTLTIGVLIGTVIQTGTRAAGQAAAPGATPLVIPSPVQMQNEFTKIARKLEPAVVNISTEYIPKAAAKAEKAVPRGGRRQQQPQPDEEDDQNNMPQFLQRFFGNGGGGFQMPEQDVPSSGVGSGVVVDTNGYILTNNHVVEKATKLKVRFMNDPTDYTATVVGTDKDTDLAVIHVDRKGLPFAKIGNSDALQVGDWAVAIGSPFGFQATVTAGIVSALARDIPGDSTSFQHFIQTDAAINPGNSGGPLLNINGDVIGINTMIASRSGGNQGIGFALPINTAVKVYNDIIKEGHVTRGSIGIHFDANPNNTELLKVYGADHGVFVRQLESGGPAEKAGIKVEDIITDINGKQIRKGQDLIDIVADTPVGTSLKVGLIRDKSAKTLNVTVGDRAKIFAELYGGKKPAAGPDSPAEATSVRFGISIQPLRPSDRDRANYKGDGVLISDVEQGSFADDIGLAKGDIIVKLNRQAVTAPEDVKKIQTGLKPGDPVAFQVMRPVRGARGAGEPQTLFLSGKVPDGNQ